MAKETRSRERGQARIQQLMEEFPQIPRTLVVKTDAIREGIKPSAGTRLAGRWALPDAKWYFSYDKEETHTVEETTAGYIRSPISGHFRDGVSLMPMFNSKSPYEIRYEERGRYRLYRDGEPMEEIFFPPRPQWYDRKTSSGRPMPSVIALRSEDYINVVPLTYCEYGKDNRQCQYCNINVSESTKKALGMERITAKREQDIYEAFLAASREAPPGTAITMSGGVILDSHKEAEVYARVLKTVKKAMEDAGVEFPILVLCQALEAEDQIMLKESGAFSLVHNLEVWDPRLFEIICPGKAKYVGRDKWLEAILRTKEMWGSTQTSFVCGVEMAPPHGFKTEDEAVGSVLAGFEWMLAHGIYPGAGLWRPAPGTIFAGLPSPRTEYFLRISLANYKMSLKYNNRMALRDDRPPSVGGLICRDLFYWGLRDAPVAGIARSAGASQAVC